MSIPKILYQLCVNLDHRAIFQQIKSHIHRFEKLHPNWQHIIFSSEKDCRDVIGTVAPEWVNEYDQFPLLIQRLDFLRAVLIFQTGGFYADLDMIFHQPIDDLCQYTCVIAEEKILTPLECQKRNLQNPLRIANYMLGATAKHPFLSCILDRISQNAQCSVNGDNDVIETTGPGVLSAVYHHKFIESNQVHVLRNTDRKCKICNRISCQFGPYASHLHYGLWRQFK